MNNTVSPQIKCKKGPFDSRFVLDKEGFYQKISNTNTQRRKVNKWNGVLQNIILNEVI